MIQLNPTPGFNFQSLLRSTGSAHAMLQLNACHQREELLETMKNLNTRQAAADAAVKKMSDDT